MKQQLSKLINKLGYNLQKVSNNVTYPNPKNYSYAPIAPSASYSPWLSDVDFKSVYEVVSHHTLVDIYRCYELWELTGQLEKNNSEGDYLEVGAWQGGTSGVIASKLKSMESTSILYIADTFEGVVKTTDNDNFYAGGEHADTSETIVVDLLEKKLNISKFRILKGIFPDESASMIYSNAKFKFCHIDVDVYQGAKEIFEWVWPKLIVGGIIVFDDYGFNSTSGVTTFVEEVRKLIGLVVIYNLNGHAIVVKTA